MSPPTVSVVMGVYNGAPYLTPSMESVLSQEGVELEFIVVNDGSTDETGAMLAAFARRDPRLKVIEQPHAGLTRALITGCASARGGFIARHDADDASLPGRLKAQAAALTLDEGLSMVSCWAEYVGPGDEVLYTRTPTLDSQAATGALLDGVDGPAHGSVMFRARSYEEVGGYRAAFYYAQDADLWRRMAQRGRLGYVPSLLYRFRVRAGSISTSRSGVQEIFNRLAHACLAARRSGVSEAPHLQEAARLTEQLAQRAPGASDSADYFIGRCLLARRDPRAGIYLRAALRDSPTDLRVWAALIESMLVPK